MSLITDPKSKYRIVLESDEGLPEEKRPWFEFRYGSISNRNQIRKRIDDIKHYVTDDSDLEKLLDIIRENLAGWGNQIDMSGADVPFEPAKLADIITLTEIGELLMHLEGQGITAADRKNSGSPSPSDTAAAVSEAETRVENAPEQKSA